MKTFDKTLQQARRAVDKARTASEDAFDAFNAALNIVEALEEIEATFCPTGESA